jgi:predicted ABC-type ATPase
LADRPVLFVLAGVNGAGKSSVGGHLLNQAGRAWYNPDSFARELVKQTGCSSEEANSTAWHEGMRRLDAALAQHQSYAFETTLGGRTVAAKIRAACTSHDVLLWFCGLASAQMHMARVKARVAAGGHAIAEAKIQERFGSSRENLIALLPYAAQVQVYDNSASVARGQAVPDPVLLADIKRGKLVWPKAIKALKNTPDWAKPILEAALQDA